MRISSAFLYQEIEGLAAAAQSAPPARVSATGRFLARCAIAMLSSRRRAVASGTAVGYRDQEECGAHADVLLSVSLRRLRTHPPL